MPVEIKELVIRAVVEPGRGQTCAAAAGSELAHPQREALLEACVRETLRILKKSKER